MKSDSAPLAGPAPDLDARFVISDLDAYVEFVASLPSSNALLNDDNRLLAKSHGWEELFGDVTRGVSLNDVTSEADIAEAVPDDASGFFDLFRDPNDFWHDALASVRTTGRPEGGTMHTLRMRDGMQVWVDWEVTPWATADGSEHGVALAFTDRTMEQRGTTIRRQLERRFDALVETISEGVLLMDDQGIFRDCNAVTERIFGRPASEIVGSKFNDEKWNGLHPDGTPMSSGDFPFWRAFFEREPVRDAVMGMYPPDEPPRWIRVNAQPLFADDDAPYAVLASLEDITDEQLKEEALQTSRDLLSSVLTSSLDGILVFEAVRDEDRTIVDFECLLANPQAEKIFHRSADDLIGHRLLEISPSHAENGLLEAYIEVVETSEPLQTEIRYGDNDVQKWFQVVAVKIEDGFAVTFRDVSERKQAVQAMAATNAKLEQRNRALRDFAYIASHDLQEPLRKISAFSNLVLEDYGDAIDDMGRHYLERMQDAAQRMSQLISDLLVYSRVTTRAQPFEPVNLERIVANVREDLDMQIRDVDGTVDIGDLPTVQADPTQMRQLLQNLIGNGLKFHREDVPPVVRLQADVLPAGTDAADGTVESDTDHVCRLTVEDNGIGFEQKYADRIFTPFKRLHGRSEYAGTGMGLAICRRIVERHGGTITVESTPDEGTTFTVYLPMSRETVSGHETSTPSDADA